MNLFLSDIKSIVRVPGLLFTLLSPVIIALLLLYGLPLMSGLFWSEDVVSYQRYYSLIAITLISAVPFIYGILFYFLHVKGSDSSGGTGSGLTDVRSGKLLLRRIAFSSILSCVMVLSSIYLTDPVSTEGWLRGIYATFLLSATAPFIFLLLTLLSGHRQGWTVLSVISFIFLITVPSGLLLHHPWNYFIFFSPFYWVNWAWVIPSVAESILYGAIAIAITAGSIFVCYRRISARF